MNRHGFSAMQRKEKYLFNYVRRERLIYKYKIGDHVYIVESGLYVKEVVVVGTSGGFYQICFTDRQGSLRLRESKLFATKEEAEMQKSAHKEALQKTKQEQQVRKGFRSPYAYEW